MIIKRTRNQQLKIADYYLCLSGKGFVSPDFCARYKDTNECKKCYYGELVRTLGIEPKNWQDISNIKDVKEEKNGKSNL